MEHERFIIERLDSYYDSVNNKGNVFLAVNVFALGGLFAGLPLCNTYINNCHWTYIWLSLMIFCNIASLLFTLRALIPYTRSYGNSLIFFGSIGLRKQADFLREFTAQDENAIRSDLHNQIYSLSIGLKQKFEWLSKAGWLFFVQAIILLPLFISVTNNLK